jgi:anthranilate phosphoribosyltransferase
MLAEQFKIFFEERDNGGAALGDNPNPAASRTEIYSAFSGKEAAACLAYANARLGFRFSGQADEHGQAVNQAKKFFKNLNW